MQSVDGVVGVHDLHVWSLTAQSHALASHVQVIEMPMSECEAILERLNHQLRDHFGIHHTTIQLEVTDCPTVDGCSQPPRPEGVDAPLASPRPRAQPRALTSFTPAARRA